MDRPPPRRRRLDPGWDEVLVKAEKRGTKSAPWGGRGFQEELQALAAWAAPSLLERRADEELVRALGRDLERLGPPDNARLAGDASLLRVRGSAQALCEELEKEEWVAAVDFADTALARRCTSVYFHDEAPAVCLVEHCNGARAYIFDGPVDRCALKCSTVARCVVLAGRCAGSSLTWVDVAEALEKLQDLRRRPTHARRADETSLELSSQPLYLNEANVLRLKDSGELNDDAELVALAAAIKAGVVNVDGVSRLVDSALAAKRGNKLTCDGLRASARLGTYATSSYIDDEGFFKPLDRALVDEAKRKLKGEADPVVAAPVAETALVSFSGEPAAKRQRGGAVLRLVKESRPPPDLGGAPPPRTEEEQHRAAALDCARLEIEAESQMPATSLLEKALPVDLLCELRARQLGSAVARSLCLTTRARDQGAMGHPYAALAWRVLDAGPFKTTSAERVLAAKETLPAPIPAAAAPLKSEADILLSADDTSGAAARWTAALAAAPNHPALYVDRADANLRSNFPGAALADAAAAFVAAPRWQGARKRLAACLAVTDPVALEALAKLDRLFDAEHAPPELPETVEAFKSFDYHKADGDAAFRAKRHVDAVAAYGRALRRPADPQKLAAAYSNRAAASAAIGSHVDALADGFAAVALAPTWLKGHVRVATALRALGRPHDAIEAYWNALRILPGDVTLNTALCDTVQEAQQKHS